MIIAHVVQRYRPAPLTGSERYMDAMTLYMLARGHRVDVYTSTALDWDRLFAPRGRSLPPGVEEYGTGLRVVRLSPGYGRQSVARLLCRLSRAPLPCFLSGPRLPGLRAALSHRYDVVHATPAPFPYLLDALRAARRSGSAFIVTPFMHFNIKSYHNPYLVSVLRSADVVIAATRCEARILARVYGAKRVRVVELGIWVNDWLQGMPGKEEARKALGIGADEFVVLLPHRARIKGAYQVLEAAMLLSKKGIKVTVLVFGIARDKGFETLKEIVKRRGVKVIDMGAVDEQTKKVLYAASDVLAQPSIADSFGIVYLEAWAARKPVVAADTLAMKCVVRHGVDGFRVPFGNAQALANVLARLALSPGLADRMGEEGYTRVLRRHDWSVAGRKLEEIYREASAK